jgi:transposase InsO family protein
VRLPARSPNLNAYAERFVRSIRSECLSKIVPLGEGHLRSVVREYTDHYHQERNHQGLGNRLIARSDRGPQKLDRIERRARLGGLLNFYDREAA